MLLVMLATQQNTDNPCVLFVDARVVSSFGPGILPITTCRVLNGSNLNCTELADASCDHSMDFGVVCRTYEQLYNELLVQQSSNDTTSTSLTYLPLTVTRSGMFLEL